MGGVGARGVRAQLRPPPWAPRSLRGEGGRPLGLGGGGGPAPPRPVGRGGEWGGEGSWGRAAVLHSPVLGEWPVASVQVPLLPRRTPPGYIRSAGVAGQPWTRWVGLAGVGGGRSLCRGLFPCLPWAGTKAGRFICAFLGAAVPLRPTAPAQGRRSAAGTAGVSGRLTGGAWRAAALPAALASPPWAPQPSRGGAGPPSLRPAYGRPRAGGGGGGEGWGGGGVPCSPPLVPSHRFLRAKVLVYSEN